MILLFRMLKMGNYYEFELYNEFLKSLYYRNSIKI